MEGISLQLLAFSFISFFLNITNIQNILRARLDLYRDRHGGGGDVCGGGWEGAGVLGDIHNERPPPNSISPGAS